MSFFLLCNSDCKKMKFVAVLALFGAAQAVQVSESQQVRKVNFH